MTGIPVIGRFDGIAERRESRISADNAPAMPERRCPAASGQRRCPPLRPRTPVIRTLIEGCCDLSGGWRQTLGGHDHPAHRQWGQRRDSPRLTVQLRLSGPHQPPRPHWAQEPRHLPDTAHHQGHELDINVSLDVWVKGMPASRGRGFRRGTQVFGLIA
jgi:hypothetical protein